MSGTSIIAKFSMSLNKTFQRKIVNIFFTKIFSICFQCSKEPFHREGSFEYPRCTFWLRNKKTFSVSHS